MKPFHRADDDPTTAEFLRHLRIAVLAIATTVLFSMSWLRNTGLYRPLWMQVLAWSILVTVTATEGVLTWRHTIWGSARWSGVALAFTASILSCLSLPTGAPGTAADWAFGTVGWIGVILLLDRPMTQLAAFLAAHQLITFTNLLLKGPADEDSVLNFVSGSIGAIGFPLACGMAATALRQTARRAEVARAQAENIRHAEHVAAQTAQELNNSYADLAHTAAPLLRGLADGSLDGNDLNVQRACWIEAARMRRLFSENDDVPNQLIHDLRQFVDTAGRRNVKAEIATYGHPTDPPDDIREVLSSNSLHVLAQSRSWAQITVVFTPNFISVQAVGDCGDIDIPPCAHTAIETENFLDTDDTTFSTEAQWQTSPSPL
ncbi:hypothetical protein PYK79_26345 [Streptomyces sp. ID05-04B]|uniref:hypothetical protein n=1 Tax=unclassified Streptomyces TaxID=2593676 RepID=UPI00131ED4F4|nr:MULTISPECIES: hypothetical protein [unclassified Streptomyces]MDX5566119.1 hypothetical protein [Streptomyces sp. ID05-04B]